MEYYDESGNQVTNPDLTKGIIINEKQELLKHHDAVKKVSHMIDLDGTKGRGENGKSLQCEVIDVPEQFAWDEYETVSIYHSYTTEEQAAYDAGAASGIFMLQPL